MKREKGFTDPMYLPLMAIPFILIIMVTALVFAGTDNKKSVHAKDKKVDKFQELTEITTVPVVFDHQGCQYPERWSNPPEGCDNTDPAVPECIDEMQTEASEQVCIKKYEQKHTPKQTDLEPLLRKCAQAFYDSTIVSRGYRESARNFQDAWIMYDPNQPFDDNTYAIGEQGLDWGDQHSSELYDELQACLPYVANQHPNGTE